MQLLAEEFAEWALEDGWKVQKAVQPGKLPQQVLDRYETLPGEYIEFFAEFDVLSDSQDTCWFLCHGDYEAPERVAFPPDAWERLSLEAAGSDEEWAGEIKAFWDVHLPFLFRVKDGYEYYAIDMVDGVIVNGCGPEFEEVKVVAPTFEKFLQKVMNWKIEL